MTQPLTTTDLEELLEHEVPCQGIANRSVARSCTAPAVLRYEGHGCDERENYKLKCVPCWQVLYQHLAHVLAAENGIRCMYCHQRFTSVEAFADYRPF